MTPALQEKAMNGHDICLSPSMSSRAVESDETLSMESSKPVKEKLKDASVTKIACSMLGLPGTQTDYSIDCFNRRYFSSPSSKHYPLVMNPNSTFHVNNKKCIQKNSEQHCCLKGRKPLCNSRNTHLSHIINSESGEQVKGKTLLGASRNLPEMGKLLDSCLAVSNNEEERQFPNYKGYQKNGFFGKALFVNPETRKGDLSHQMCDDALELKMICSPRSKEEQLNLRLLQCINKQQALLSRAKRTQKRLQILLAKHVVRHCDQQMKCFVRHQLQRMKAFRGSTSALDGSYNQCTKIKTENNSVESNTRKDVLSDEIKMFAHCSSGLLSQVEKSLDSEATCSSSSEDDDEQISRNVLPVNYRSDWKWLVDRAKVGCRWTWLQAQISELEYKIQQLTDLHRQIRATKEMVILEECPTSKDVLKKQTQLTDQEVLLKTTGNSEASLERQDVWPEHDFEMSPSSPTLLLRNIEKQSAQLSEIISSLISPLNLSPTSSPLSSKSCKQKELVNGISLRDSENNESISCSSSWLVKQQHLKRRRKEKAKLRTSSVATMSTSARTRPLQNFQRRKLYKINTAFNSNEQVMQFKDASSWSTHELSSKSRRQEQLMLELDTSFHPVLSFPSDIPLHVHFKTLLKKYEIKGSPFETSALGLEYKMSPSNVFCQYRTPMQQWCCGSESTFRHQSMTEMSEQLPEGRKKRHISETLIGESNNRCEAVSSQHEESESHSRFAAPPNGDMISRSNQSTSTQLNSRRRLRSESSYDIDNIVIPMSLVAPSKLEKLQYKEILTPSWRIVSLEPLDKLPEEEKEEDLSDDAYAARHTKYEDKERARWSLWEQYRWPRRNRTYSRSSEWQDPALREKQANSDLTSRFSEGIADLTSETYSSFCLRVSQASEEDEEAKCILWERRVFPLKDKEADALMCQNQVVAPQDNSEVTVPCDAYSTSYPSCSLPNNLSPKKSSADELEECNIYSGTSNMRKQR
uniref:KAT8 regulatory NSL complex subunit 1 like n=1 Tax=Salvator merianae TaxID=96440 RepID=A0A8D0E7S4_SALMN